MKGITISSFTNLKTNVNRPITHMKDFKLQILIRENLEEFTKIKLEN